ncbi:MULTISPECIES: recombinase family protein [Streptomycetaceae]|uniref:Resolvase/invertase-type recombinase catalytic domain-containing protein n=1 Tax=Streptantibioticus cattleyicolor (strain ATCC 35852 / DSM 46488 / JCM 4925 / NBRC 14057 / NRRL 8057) TaxID=1003195 RepID=F8JUI9_STREN|nr:MULTISPECIES: recombinase family protein [Streptomycetaceae]AEW95610.1 hypothetical protein SCATT_32390 [Streptantibioticus cattleyicolor NRRL 8057 = DSM 46488]MYS60159.1 recombinase family protein [Streptomyces sp. SID5468]CCB75948.1 protein of unknown function [Streptantibioticus cattleyicolor NRRL 8057 = DSM 46488]
MVSVEGMQRQRRVEAHRSEGDLRRRRALADAAAGITTGEADVPTKAAKVERFRCVIYLCGEPPTDTAARRKECTGYAEAFGWEIADVIEEHAGLLPPHARTGLAQAVEQVRSGHAKALLTARRSMISTTPQQYAEVAREVENAGGFLHVMDSGPATGEDPYPRDSPTHTVDEPSRARMTATRTGGIR